MAEPLDLEALERLLGEATPGPWRGVPRGPCAEVVATADRRLDLDVASIWSGENDQRLIVALRNAAPELLRLARQALQKPRRMVCEIIDERRRPPLPAPAPSVMLEEALLEGLAADFDREADADDAAIAAGRIVDAILLARLRGHSEAMRSAAFLTRSLLRRAGRTT